MSRWRPFLSATLYAALAAALCGCGGKPQPGGGPPAAQVAARVAAEHLQRHLTQSPSTLDPSLARDVGEYAIVDDLFEGLVRADAEGRIVPAAASSWESSADGLTWRFHLRPEALWSNGDPVTAADFVFAWRRIVDPATGASNAPQLAAIAGAADILAQKAGPDQLAVRATDPHTLEVQLTEPVPYFLYLLTNSWMMPLHAPTLQRWGRQWTDPAHLVGNGPFLLRSWVINGPVELARNPRYWDQKSVRLQAVTWIPLPDTAAATARLLAGDLDIADRFQVGDIDWLRNTLGAEQVRLEPSFQIVMLALKVTAPPLTDPRVRQALSMALDREILVGKLLKATQTTAWSLVPPLPGYEPVRPDWARLGDDARHREAQRLYASAGYSAAHPLRLELWYPNSDADTRRVFEAMAAMWHMTLGAQVQLVTEEWSAFQQSREVHKYPLFFYSWSGDYPDPVSFLTLALPGNLYNYMEYDSAEFASAVQAGGRATDEAGRYAAFRQAEQILNRDAVFIPIYFRTSKHLVSSRVRGWHANAMDRHASRDLYLAAMETGG